MTERRGVLMIMYDLPRTGRQERSDAARFQRTLLKMGYMMLQESIYIKLLKDRNNGLMESTAIKSIAPEKSDIRTLTLTLNDFRGMYTVKGAEFNISLFADDLLII